MEKLVNQKNDKLAFLPGGGEMATLTRNFDWAQTSLGDPVQWPQSLKTMVGVLLSSRFPMFLFWGTDHIQFYNDAYRPSLGIDGKHPLALGQKGVDCWFEIWSFIKPLINQVMAGSEAILYENQLLPIFRNGKMEDVYWDFSYSPVQNENGVIEGVLVVCQEVTEQKLFTEELSKQVRDRTIELENKNKELERSNSNLEEFAHAASHDLKEPIRKIHFFTDMLKEQLSERLTEEEKTTLNRIENASLRMSRLIDDLLIYSHVSQRPQEKENVDLNEKILKVMEDLELEIRDKKAKINIGPLPLISGYGIQLQQLFQNLVSNALKYSKQGSIPEINISAGIVDGYPSGKPKNPELLNRKYVKIEVADKGIGFEQENAERIFQMFTRLHGQKEYRGTGIGLSIARKVVENHDGKITAKSDPGKGSIFKIYLPL